MSVKIGINGFRRIGRNVHRALRERDMADRLAVALASPGPGR